MAYFQSIRAEIDQTSPASAKAEERIYITQQQDNAILNWLSEHKWDPQKMPVPPKGKAGVKKDCRDALCKDGKKMFSSSSVFNTAWERLRANKKIKDA